MTTLSIDHLLNENEHLRRRLEEAEDTIRALRAGEVDAVVVEAGREQIYTLESADRPYQLLVSQIPQPAATLTIDGTILYCNSHFAELLQCPQESLLGRPIRDYVAPESRTDFDTLLADNQSAAARGEIKLLRADGTRKSVHFGVNISEAGVLGRCLVVTDLTDQEALRRAEQSDQQKSRMLAAARMLASIVESSADAIVSKTLDGIIQSWNAAAERLFGYTADQAIGRHISLVIPPDRIREEDEIIGRLRAGKVVDHFETVRVRSDGRLIQVSLTISPIRDEAGRIIGASKIARDITEQKRVEAALRRSEALFRQLADAMPQMVWAARPDGFIDYYNERWYEYTGFKRDNFGQESWEPILHPDDVKRCVETYADCINGERPYQIEYRFKDRRTGGYRWFLGRAVPVRDETGHIIRWFGTCTDIDDAKRLQEELQEADRKKDEFLATLAHELRSPLAPIRHAVQILTLRGPSQTDLVWARGVVERQVQVMARLLEDLLDVSRISRNKLNLRKEQVELAAVVEAALETSRPAINAAGHELTVALPPEPIQLFADPVRLAQVFSNLLNNSAKYTDGGGHIWLTARREGSDVLVSVKDSGIGIGPETLPFIFEIFSQERPALARSQGGLGIGLSLVKGLVELHGGHVEARSEGPHKGSEFIVRLPVATGKTAAMEQQSKEIDRVVHCRILVADDNRDSADSLATLLRIMGNEVVTAYDGEQAVKQTETMRPDVALLDIGMPKLNGYDACRRIREQPWGKEILLIALTGWGQDEDRRRTEEAGFDHHVVKPVDPTVLMRMLASRCPEPPR